MTGLIREHIIKRFKRSSQWPKVRKQHLKREPRCRVCGRRWNRQVHHILPVHLFPQYELDPSNLITLCGRCHLLFGHLNNWRRYNPAPSLREDVRTWSIKLKGGDN